MSLVKQGVNQKHLKENEKISGIQMQKALGIMYSNLKSNQLTSDFDESFKSLKI